MAEIELVIKVSEEVRVAITRMGLLRVPDEMQKEVDRAIQNGTPLPKGHGRIGDFDTFLKGFLFDKRADNLECGWIRELIEQVTIIGAD